MKVLVRGCVVIMAVQLSGFTYSQEAVTLAGDKFQNVTVLHTMPADQMGKVMNIMSAALGVSCVHCHKGYDFASEDAAKKATARQMIAMTLALNKDQFGGRTVVNCMTCHQGQTKPPDASQSATELAKTSAPRLPRVLPVPRGSGLDSKFSVEQILESYEKSIHVASNVPQRLASLRARRIEPDGKKEEVTIELPSNHHWQQTTVYERVTLRETYRDGQVAKTAGDKELRLKPDEVSMIKIAGHLALGLPLKSLFDKWSVADPALIGDKRMRVLQAVEGELTHLFMFDEETGLLRRRSMSMPTVLGAHVVEVAYDDYEAREGRQLPMKTTFSMPSVNWQIEFVASPERHP